MEFITIIHHHLKKHFQASWPSKSKILTANFLALNGWLMLMITKMIQSIETLEISGEMSFESLSCLFFIAKVHFLQTVYLLGILIV